jgi:uncharacterized protein involved in exopolysaccharide biosynthesis
MRPHFILTALLLAPLLPGQDTAPPPPPAPPRAGESGAPALRALAAERDQLESAVRGLLKSTGDEIIQFAADLEPPDQQFRERLQKYLEVSADLAGLQEQGLGNEHPAAVAKKQELQALGAQLGQGVVALRDSLQAKLEVADSRYKKALAGTGDDFIRNRVVTQDYVDARRTYESEQRMLQTMKLKRARVQISAEPDSARGITELNRMIRTQEDTVDQCRKVLANIVRARGIVYYDPADAGRSQQPAVQPPPAANPLKADKVRLEHQLKFLNELTGESLLTFAGNLGFRDNPVAELHRRRLLAGLDLEGLKANGLGDDHPKVITQTRMIEALQAQLDAAVVALRDTLQAQLTLVKAQLPVQPAKPE